MKALYLSNMTDLFGDMPFKEAFKGIDENIMQPKFDDQKVIYDSLLMDLERANTLYTKTSTIDAKRDLLYNGDVTKWRKFTNSLYLRLLMRVSNRRDMNSAERIKTVFENPSQYPIFESNDDNATLKYSGTRPFVNDFGDNATDDSAMGERFINIMVDSSDPPASRFYCSTRRLRSQRGRLRGNHERRPGFRSSPSSRPSGASNSNNTTFRQYTSPYTFMTYSEVLFIKAEAIQRGMMDGEASETYYAAVTASLKQWIPDISESAVETFLQNGAVAYDATTEIIITQKYVSLFTVGYESWHEYRRTGYPLLVMGEAIRNDGVHPTRFPYPLVLRSSNKNYATQLAKMGEDNMKTPVWWSRKAVKLENPEEDNNLGYTGHKWDADIKW
ncbi:MAG: SusD/RagB family nutrient-binding outer membrane lipoprotein [Alistipes finegoldii]